MDVLGDDGNLFILHHTYFTQKIVCEPLMVFGDTPLLVSSVVWCLVELISPVTVIFSGGLYLKGDIRW